MDPWSDVRLRARACHAEALALTGGGRSAEAIIAAATRLRGIEVAPLARPDQAGTNALAVLDREGLTLRVDGTLSRGLRALVVGRAIGHYELDSNPLQTVAVAEATSSSAARLVGHAHRDRSDVAADVFATEFLVPGDWLRDEVVDGRRRPSEVAAEFGLPRSVVARQAVHAVCLPPLRARSKRTGSVVALDPMQARAASWSGGALFVHAGPGTGKTATLVGRVAHLLGSGVPPASILVLTFGNNAAAEVRSRVAAIAPDAAGALWVGTIHALGLEMLRRWHHRVGRSDRLRVLDRDGALELLERNLDALPFVAGRDPLSRLSQVASTIARLKDEMVTPGEYLAAVRAAGEAQGGTCQGSRPSGPAGAGCGGAAIAAAAEIAAAYAAYERLLAREDALDLGDLVSVAARLLEENADVALHYGERFAHLLVDEVQDLNHAATRLLRAVCGPSTSTWAVGDACQQIYRFRGAGGGVFDDVATVFGGDVVALDRSYRATPEIVGAFSAFAGAAMPGRATTWDPQRPSGEPVRRLCAETQAGEVAALRDRIEELRARGVAYGDQAVLGRTHRTLERVGAGLERHGVPVSYLGDLFARGDVRDLLSMLSVGAEPGGVGLLRVATKPPYAVSREGVLALIRGAAASGATMQEALRHPESASGVDARDARGLALLGRHLSAAGPNATAWAALVEWLFETHATLVGEGVAPMTRVAAYQLLRLAAEEGTGPRACLARVRRIAALGGGREHGVVPAEARSEDAVRLLTVHAAKGLEFAAVHLPFAAARFLPLCQRSETCAPPPGLGHLALSASDHAAEERALWFVAASRARDHLTVSHARRYGGARETRPSPFVAMMGRLADSRHADPGLPEPDVALRPQPPRSAYPASELETYLRCPARYRYEVVDGLAEVVPLSGYRRATGAVMAATRGLEAIASRGRTPTYGDGTALLSAAWATHGPVGHPHESAYRVVAERLVCRLVEIVAMEFDAIYHRGEWAIDVGNAIVIASPHRIVVHPWRVVSVQIVGARRSAAVANMVAALEIGARAAFPSASVSVETVDADSGDVVEDDPVKEGAVIARYRAAVDDIERGAFGPRPDPRSCPSCPFFFVCGA